MLHFQLRRFFLVLLVLLAAGCNNSQKPKAGSVGSEEADKKVIHIGYQGMINPWKVGIRSGAFAKATGWRIEWRKFNVETPILSVSDERIRGLAFDLYRGIPVPRVYVRAALFW